MAHKHVLFRATAREKTLRGTTRLSDAVRATENAVSVGSVLLPTEVTMTGIPEPKIERALDSETGM